jgi:hypothetical protein
MQNVNVDDFTQLVWKNTSQVGFGIAKSIKPHARFVAVAFYYPKGNEIGEYEHNVKKTPF